MKASVDLFIEVFGGSTINNTISIVNFFDELADTPLNIKYESAEAYIKHQGFGTIYERSVYLSDRDDKFHGYAFYLYGSTQRADIDDFLTMRYPVSRISSNVYDYNYEVTKVKSSTYNTPSFDSSNSFYNKLATSYNSFGDNPYAEYFMLKNLAYSYRG